MLIFLLQLHEEHEVGSARQSSIESGNTSPSSPIFPNVRRILKGDSTTIFSEAAHQFDQTVCQNAGLQNYVDLISHVDLRQLNLMVLGSGGVGKTSLIHKLSHRAPSRHYERTNGVDVYPFKVRRSGEVCEWFSPQFLDFRAPSYGSFGSIYSDVESPTSSTPIIDNLKNIADISRGGPTERAEMINMKVLDTCGDGHLMHHNQMLMTPANVYLVVLDASQDFDAAIPATFEGTTVGQFLNSVLGCIGTFAGYDTKGKAQAHTLLALSKTDCIVTSQRQNRVEEYKCKLREHLQSQGLCKFVHGKIFDLNKPGALQILKNTVVELGCFKNPPHEDRKQISWVKLENDIQTHCVQIGKQYLPLLAVQQVAESQLKMSPTEFKLFLEHQYYYRNLVFADEGMSSNPILVTDPKFLFQKRREVDHPEKDTLARQSFVGSVRHHEPGCVSLTSLTHCWGGLPAADAESLAAIMIKLKQFWPQESIYQDQDASPMYLIPDQLPRESGGAGAFEEVDSLEPVVYLFHNSVKLASGFLPEYFFEELVRWLRDNLPEDYEYLPDDRYSGSASFNVDPDGYTRIDISRCAYALVLKILRIDSPSASPASSLAPAARSWVEKGIDLVLKRLEFPLHCSVHISPCEGAVANGQVQYACLKRKLGLLGEVRKDKLRVVDCPVRDHKKAIDAIKFRGWFCSGSEEPIKYQRANDMKKLNDVAEKISGQSSLRTLGINLSVDARNIETQINQHQNDIRTAAQKVLHDWYNMIPGDLREGGEKWDKLYKAVKAAGLVMS